MSSRISSATVLDRIVDDVEPESVRGVKGGGWNGDAVRCGGV